MWSENGDLAFGWEWRVKETMNWRYCWRAGVISRNEREEGEELLVLMVFFREKAHSLVRETVVREGMSVGEIEWKEIPSRVMEQGYSNVQLYSPLVVSDLSLGKSIHQFISSSPLRMINSLESSSMKLNAPSPSRMEVSSGKSIHHSLFKPFTLKDGTRTLHECNTTK